LISIAKIYHLKAKPCPLGGGNARIILDITSSWWN